LKKGVFISLAICFICTKTFSQARFSLATEIALQRSLQKDQQFWAVGQNIIGQWHFSSAETVYALIGYYAPGSFNNALVGSAKSPTTNPQEVGFRNHATIRLKEVSIGWHHYFKGRFDNDDKWNVYGIAGFGLVYGKATNAYAGVPDTSLYNLPAAPVSGTGLFKRLTVDLGLGYEMVVGDEFYLYGEAKTWIPTTQYPSKFLFVNKNAPLVAVVSLGVRILF
jgi:hypothetical protein